MRNVFLALLLGGAAALGSAQAADGMAAHSRPADARVYIISPADGAHVGPTVTVRFGLSGMGVAPAGVMHANTGHHHLLVDVDTLPKAGVPIPNDAHHHHFGGGQTQTTLHLTPGTHTLQLELADAAHVPFDPPLVSKKITIHVK
ncbi:DUF4399 domain-containing protein [Oleiagrimonas sp. C23AA]|uniref:DUF4399 domain-containing protein n=1 Tax=Oleiagrimonas sp. C23AA TaxID=2719047 RepID=UPI001422E759|nr:DUF4399 domain-containing protein [Oleiagrimonas sp. C23AA]NII10184.1 DUF4399 domain-containing protein [Oleiagrimonas sp. C23AA]